MRSLFVTPTMVGVCVLVLIRVKCLDDTAR